MAGPSVNAMGNGRLWVFSGVGFGSVSDDMTSIPYDVLFVAVYNIIFASSLLHCFASRTTNKEMLPVSLAECLFLCKRFPKNGARL